MTLTKEQEQKLETLTELLKQVSEGVWEETYYGDKFPDTTKLLQQLQREGVEINFQLTPKPYLVEEDN